MRRTRNKLQIINRIGSERIVVARARPHTRTHAPVLARHAHIRARARTRTRGRECTARARAVRRGRGEPHRRACRARVVDLRPSGCRRRRRRRVYRVRANVAALRSIAYYYYYYLSAHRPYNVVYILNIYTLAVPLEKFDLTTSCPT